MGVVTATVGVTSVLPYLRIGSVQADYALSKRPVCRFQLNVRTGTSYRPAVQDTVRITDDGADLFYGCVFALDEQPIVSDKHNRFDVTCVGFEYFASVVPVNGIIAAGTLKAQMQALSPLLVSHGITFDTTMATGPTLPAQGFPWRSVAQALDQLMVAAGAEWAWRINGSKELTAAANSASSAPVALADWNSNVHKLKTTTTLKDYRNSGWIVYGEGQQEATQTWTGNGVQTSFALSYSPVGVPSRVDENGTSHLVGVIDADPTRLAPVWNYEPTTNTLQRTGGALPNGQILTWTGVAQYPAALYAEDTTEVGLRGLHGFVITNASVFDVETATALLDGELARRNGLVREVDVTTFSAGLAVGQEVHVTATNYDLSDEQFMITALSVRHALKKPNGQHLFRYSMHGVEGNATRMNWRDHYALSGGNGLAGMGGGGSSSVGSGGSGGSSTVTITGPFRVWLGGTQRRLFTAAASGTWFDAPDGVEWSATGAQIPGSIFVRVHLRTRGGANATIRARLFDETNSVSLGEGADVTADAWTYVGFFVTLPAAEVIVKLQLRVTGSAATTAETGYWSSTIENRPS